MLFTDIDVGLYSICSGLWIFIQPTQGLICFSYFWKHLLASQPHSLLQDLQAEHSVLQQSSLWLFNVYKQVLNPALSKRSRVAPKRTLSLSAFSKRSVSRFNALGTISAKLRCNSSVISSAHSLRSLQAWLRNVCVSLYPAFFAASKWSPERTYSSTNTCLWLVKLCAIIAFYLW